jgi:hypothetical protein
MALTTRRPGEIIIANNPEYIVFGTCMLGDTFGSVESASVKRGADTEEIMKCGGALLAYIMKNPFFELTLKVLFTSDVTPPELGQLIEFPLAGISGRIIPSIDIEWEKDGQRMMSITAKSWDSLNNEGAGSAEFYDGTNPAVDLDPAP